MDALQTHIETHRSQRAGWLRAAVLGANDGLISTGSLVLGMATAGAAPATILLSGIAGLAAGAFSMAAGEYVSVSSQADAERADARIEADALRKYPDAELAELTEIYMRRGVEPTLARQVAEQLTDHDDLGAHLRDELGIHDVHRARPVQAAVASAAAFTAGALPPVLLAWQWRGQNLPMAPVSYTHLDVYKRQAPSCTCVSAGSDRRCGTTSPTGHRRARRRGATAS